jgi:hypothetical protein
MKMKRFALQPEFSEQKMESDGTLKTIRSQLFLEVGNFFIFLWPI